MYQFRNNQKDQLDRDVEFIIRDRESIIDFLYEI